MDLIDDEQIEAVCHRSLNVTKKLFPEPLTAIFYDTTTLYFESEKEDALRLKGYSRDGKSHRVQVLFDLPVTQKGLPVGYELFPGDKYEGNTLVDVLESLESSHAGVGFTVVADAGMINKKNEEALRRRGTPYILGARLKSCSKEEKQKILDPGGYDPWSRDEHSDSVAFIRSIGDGDSRLIVTCSPRRARKDAGNRALGIEKLQSRLDKSREPASHSNRGSARFLDFPDGQVSLNEDKIAEAERRDGLRGIVAWGCDDMDPLDLVIQYRRLSEIESCFRTDKHDLSIRPVFHWKEQRVRAHIAVCYMAFCCLQHLRHRLAIRGYRMSPDRIRRALNELQTSILYEKSGQRKFGLPCASSSDAWKIYRTLGLNWNRAPFIYTQRRKR